MGENAQAMSDSAVKAIQQSVETKVIEVGDQVFTTRQVYDPPKDNVPTVIALNTLQGILDYVNNGPDGVKAFEEGLMVVVIDHQTVEVTGGLFGRAHQRKVFARATAQAVLGGANSGFVFGKYYDCEEFIIKLQALFQDYDGRADVLRVVGNIKEETVRQTEDDGVTQTVTGRTGIARVGDVKVPNPVYLAPYRTFREVDQPLSPFVLRMKSGDEGDLPTVALFEADGGQWRLDAIASIRDFLSESIKDVSIIA